MWIDQRQQGNVQHQTFSLVSMVAFRVCMCVRAISEAICSIYMYAFACLYIHTFLYIVYVCFIQARWKDAACRTVAAKTREQWCSVERTGLLEKPHQETLHWKVSHLLSKLPGWNTDNAGTERVSVCIHTFVQHRLSRSYTCAHIPTRTPTVPSCLWVLKFECALPNFTAST